MECIGQLLNRIEETKRECERIAKLLGIKTKMLDERVEDYRKSKIKKPRSLSNIVIKI